MPKASLVNPLRSVNMSRIRSKDTGPELLVRSALHRLGLRFRLYRRDLPGSPDIVLHRHRIAIFVHGCFWHRHENCRRASLPKTRQDYWGPKLAHNVARDLAASEKLKTAGWRVEVIWECDACQPARLLA
ncbi:very short patch repair endonuclease, partial [Streptomyces sp. 2MCAF27]